jgi:hypothetical protein
VGAEVMAGVRRFIKIVLKILDTRNKTIDKNQSSDSKEIIESTMSDSTDNPESSN